MKNKSASALGKLSREKRLKMLRHKGISESQYMRSIRLKGIERERRIMTHLENKSSHMGVHKS